MKDLLKSVMKPRARSSSKIFVVMALFAFAYSCYGEDLPSHPRLVLFLVADQFPQEYLTRFRPLLREGLKTLVDKGVVFDETRYFYADTETCPGHASLATGTYPSHSGIVANSWFNRAERREIYCVDDDKFTRSPHYLLTSTIGDWLKGADSHSKVYSASAKDRAAIMLGGHAASAAYWYDQKTGDFTSSEYYANACPLLLEKFNNKRLLLRHFGSIWEALTVDQDALKRAQIVDLNEGVYPDKFPHALGSASAKPNSKFFTNIYLSPFIDRYLVDFAQYLIKQTQLGKDDHTDFLGLSFSAPDTVGHGYGPNSREVLDTVLRLDRELGRLFTFIDKEIGLQRTLISFSSDHGVQPLPEYRKSIAQPASRLSAKDVECIQRAGKNAMQQFDVSDLFLFNGYLNDGAITRHKLNRREIEDNVQRELEECEIFARIWLARDLQTGVNSNLAFFNQYRNSFYPERSPDFIPQLKEYHLSTPYRGTGHGTPYEYDTHVPMILLSPKFTPQRIAARVSPVDLAPTLASLVGLNRPMNLDGLDRSLLIRQSLEQQSDVKTIEKQSGDKFR